MMTSKTVKLISSAFILTFINFSLFGAAASKNLPSLEDTQAAFEKISTGDKDAIVALKNRIKDTVAQKKIPSSMDMLLLRQVPDKADAGIFLKELLNTVGSPVERSAEIPENVFVSPRSFTAADLRGNILAEFILNFYANPKADTQDRIFIIDELRKLQKSDMRNLTVDKLLISLWHKGKDAFPALWTEGVNLANYRMANTKRLGYRVLLAELMYQHKVLSPDEYATFLKNEYLQNKEKQSGHHGFERLTDTIIKNKTLFDEKFLKDVYEFRKALSEPRAEEFELSGYKISRKVLLQSKLRILPGKGKPS